MAAELMGRPSIRPIRGHQKPSSRATSRVVTPRDEWIEIPVPPPIDPALFEAARGQLDQNRNRKRDREPGQRWLLQGLTVCPRCGYAYYGKKAPRSRTYDPANALRYYRCTGVDGYRFNGNAVCHNGPVLGDQLEQVVWSQARSVLEQPDRVFDDYRRRIGLAQDGAAMPDEIVRLNGQITTMRRGIGRLIDSYAEGLVDKTEFDSRSAGLKHHLSQLEERHRAALDAIEVERDLSLVISRLEDFSAKVAKRHDDLDRLGMQEIIRILVRRIEIGGDAIEVVFRVPPLEGPGRSPLSDKTASWKQCTGVSREVLRLIQPKPPPRQGLRGDHRLRDRLSMCGLRNARHPKAREAGMSF
jgi:site-specific DNA recombinase